MKSFVLLTVIALCMTGCGTIGRRPGSRAVVVQELQEQLPIDENLRSKWLWDHFAKKPAERQFATYTVSGWKRRYDVFSLALTRKAAKAGFGSASLSRILKQIRREDSPMLPVGAYQTTLGRDRVWIVVIKWETLDLGGPLGHVMMYAFTQTDRRQVGFMSCG